MFNIANSLAICTERTLQVDVFYYVRLCLVILTIILFVSMVAMRLTKRPGLKRFNKGLSIILLVGMLGTTGLYFLGSSSPRYKKGSCNSSSGFAEQTLYVEPPRPRN